MHVHIDRKFTALFTAHTVDVVTSHNQTLALNKKNWAIATHWERIWLFKLANWLKHCFAIKCVHIRYGLLQCFSTKHDYLPRKCHKQTYITNRLRHFTKSLPFYRLANIDSFNWWKWLVILIHSTKNVHIVSNLTHRMRNTFSHHTCNLRTPDLLTQVRDRVTCRHTATHKDTTCF